MDFGADSCCSDSNEITIVSDYNDMENDQEEEKGCCNTDCECMCCAHVFLGEKIRKLDFCPPVLHVTTNSTYTNNYFCLLTDLIWQPPRII